ncbi:MAG: diguanylate cyclase [Bacillota bacterium]
MNAGTAKIWFSLAVPLGLLVPVCFYLSGSGTENGPWGDFIRCSSPFIFTVGLALSYWFNQSRIFFTILFLAATQAAFHLAGRESGNINLNAVFLLSSFLVPLNVLAFSLMHERGILTRLGRMRLGAVLSEFFFLLYLAGPGIRIIPGLAGTAPAVGKSGLSAFPGISIFMFILALLIFSARLFFKSPFMESSFIGVLIALGAALISHENPLAIAGYYSTAGAILVVAIIHDSYSKAYLDDLTGLPGRRALRETLIKLEGRYSIAMLDIDHFKSFNDMYGHDVGDEALRFIASMVRNISGGGKAFRYGGEEFTIVFPGKRLSESALHLEALRQSIANRGFVLRGKDRPRKKPQQIKPAPGSIKKINITVSIGVSESSSRLKNPNSVLKAADSALYRAKEQGRNLVAR